MDTNVLDNPIWNALISGNMALANGDDGVKYFGDDVAPFIGMADYKEENMQNLVSGAPRGRKLVIFSSDTVRFPEELIVEEYIKTYQMVYESLSIPNKSDIAIRDLGRVDVPKMLALTEATKPGPFFQNTIDFGHYQGVFEKERLVSMAGYRLNPFNCTEISAVCTAEDSLGKGYAGAILSSQITSIVNKGDIPFLHVKVDNERAISRYERSGFTIRKLIHIYLFHRL